MTMSAAMIKELKKMSKHKKTAPLFLFLEGQMHLYPSVHFLFSCYRFVETIFKMKLNMLQNIQIF